MENRLMDMGRGEERVRCMEGATWKHITICKIEMGICCMAQETQTGALYHSRGVGWVGDGRKVQKRADICIPMADSF